MDDIIADIMRRVAVVVTGKNANALLAQIEAEVRAEWGGDRPYIAKLGEDAVRERSTRNAAIVRDYQRGERVGLLARRYGISHARVSQIVRAG